MYEQSKNFLQNIISSNYSIDIYIYVTVISISDCAMRVFSCFLQVGIELVPLLKQSQAAGKPRKDPSTGYTLSHSLSTTDVTKAQVPGNVHRYYKYSNNYDIYIQIYKHNICIL